MEKDGGHVSKGSASPVVLPVRSTTTAARASVSKHECDHIAPMLRILQWLPSLLSLLQGLQGRSGPSPNFWLYFMPLSFSVAKQQTHRVSSYSLQHQVTSHCTAVRKPFPLLECLLSPTGTPSTCLLLRIQAQPNHHFLREASPDLHRSTFHHLHCCPPHPSSRHPSVVDCCNSF